MICDPCMLCYRIIFVTSSVNCKIGDSHDGEYEDCGL